jgi:glycosyltransferase involved in cell wall biosynthesis
MIMAPPSFSICIPNYNYGRFIGQTIQSVLNQTYQSFEIIVADNASSDNSVQVVESFRDSRIRLVRNNYNIGFAPNLQRASMFAQNDFINLLSSDDLMNPTALETYAAILSERADTAHRTVLTSDAELVDAEGRVVGHVRKDRQAFDTVTLQGAEDDAFMRVAPESFDRYQTFAGLDVLKETLARLRNFAPFLTVVYPRSLWQAVEGYNAVRTIGPDKFFHYKLLAQNPDVIYVPTSLYRYRVHVSPNQEAQKTNIKQQLDDYLYTLEYSDPFLASLGLTREVLVNAFLNRVCLKNGLTQLVYGSYTHAFRMLACALAAYPKEAVRQKRFYTLLGLLACGPFAQRLARLFYGSYHEQELKPFLGED